MSRLVSILALGLLLAGCQTTASAPKPSPSPAHHNTVATAVVQPNEVPGGLTICPGSGPIAGYLTALHTSDASLATRLTDQWHELQSKGATAAAITLYAYAPTACTVELAASSTTKALSSFVAEFADEGQAERAWASGILGFTTPAPNLVAPGILRGAGTGLGASSWTYTSTQTRLACWRRSVFVALVVLSSLDSGAYGAVTSAIDARLN